MWAPARGSATPPRSAQPGALCVSQQPLREAAADAATSTGGRGVAPPPGWRPGLGPRPKERFFGFGRPRPSPLASRDASCSCRHGPTTELASHTCGPRGNSYGEIGGPPTTADAGDALRRSFLAPPVLGEATLSRGVLGEVAESVPPSASRSWVPTHARRRPPWRARVAVCTGGHSVARAAAACRSRSPVPAAS